MEWITPYFYRTMSILPPFHIVQSYDNMDVLKNITLTYYINSGGSLVAKLCPTLATPWTVAHQAPLSMGFPRQKYWSGLLFPSPRDLPNRVVKPMSPALAGGFFTWWVNQPGMSSQCMRSSVQLGEVGTGKIAGPALPSESSCSAGEFINQQI